jgi:hypothetical protein
LCFIPVRQCLQCCILCHPWSVRFVLVILLYRLQMPSLQLLPRPSPQSSEK